MGGGGGKGNAGNCIHGIGNKWDIYRLQVEVAKNKEWKVTFLIKHCIRNMPVSHLQSVPL